MHFYWRVCGLLFSSFLFFGCAKKAPSGQSKIVFQMPQGLQQKAGGIQSFSSNACFAVNIIADDIQTSNANSCDPGYGLFGGLVPAGGTIELEADYGSNRTVEIYYVITTNGCSPFDPNAQGLAQTFGSNKVFRISQLQNVDFNQPEIVLEVPIEWPDSSNSLSTLMSLPTTCETGSNPVNLMAIKQARIVQGAARGSTANGSQMQIKILNKKIDMTPPNTWSGRIFPNRLGEEQ